MSTDDDYTDAMNNTNDAWEGYLSTPNNENWDKYVDTKKVELDAQWKDMTGEEVDEDD